MLLALRSLSWFPALRLLCLSVGTAFLAACYSGPGTQAADSNSYTARNLPLGVLASPNGSGLPRGIFEGSGPDDTDCCWLSSQAVFQVNAAPKSHLLELVVYLPDTVPIYASRPESVSVRINGKKIRTFPHLNAGIATLRVPLQPAGSGSPLTVTMDMAYAWTFSQEGLGSDSRPLSLYLKIARTF
jgi:hypothetical protein